MDNTPTHFQSLFSSYPQVTHPKGEILSFPTEVPYVLYLLEGNVKMSTITEEGNEIVYHVFSPGSIFPMMIVLSALNNSYQFQVLSKMTAYKIPTSEALTILHENPAFSFDLLTRCSKALMGMIRRVESLATYSVSMRIRSLFSYFFAKYGATVGVPLNLTLRHEDIAAWVGTSRETVSREISALQRQGIIQLRNKKLTILKPDLLQNHEV